MLEAAFVDNWESLRSNDDRIVPNAFLPRFESTVSALGSRPWTRVYDDQCAILGRLSQRRLSGRIGYLPYRSPFLTCVDVVYEGVRGHGEEWEGVIASGISREFNIDAIDCFSFNHVRVDSRLHRILLTIGGVGGRIDPHWTLELNGSSFDDLMIRHSSKHRSNLRRLDRRIEQQCNGKLKLECHTSEQSVAGFVAAARSVQTKSYHAELHAGIHDTDLWTMLLRRDAAEGRMQCYTLTRDAEPVAYQAGVVIDGTFFAEATSYVAQLGAFRPGTVLLMRVLRHLCENRVASRVDFGFGDAEYKRTYGTESWDEQTILLFGSSIRAILAKLLFLSGEIMARSSTAIGSTMASSNTVKRIWRRRFVRRLGLERS